jgi:hypothetical protein
MMTSLAPYSDRPAPLDLKSPKTTAAVKKGSKRSSSGQKGEVKREQSMKKRGGDMVAQKENLGIPIPNGLLASMSGHVSRGFNSMRQGESMKVRSNSKKREAQLNLKEQQRILQSFFTNVQSPKSCYQSTTVNSVIPT